MNGSFVGGIAAVVAGAMIANSPGQLDQNVGGLLIAGGILAILKGKHDGN